MSLFFHRAFVLFYFNRFTVHFKKPCGDDPQECDDAAVLLRPEKDALRIDLVGVGFGDVLFEEKDGFAGLHDAVVLGGGDFAEMFDDDGVHAVCRIDAKDIEKI